LRLGKALLTVGMRVMDTSSLDRYFSCKPRIFCAPGRVNIIGEHTDYNDGFVMPAAIGLAARVAITPLAADVLEIHSLQFNESVEVELTAHNAKARTHWSDYVRGVALILQQSGYPLRGAKLVVDSGVPMGAGLSSSAALEIATALALLANAGISASRTEIARLCQRAENEFVGARSGIMDQFASALSRSGQVMFLDCRSLHRIYLPFPAQFRLVVGNTMIKHQLASGEYNKRREECEHAVSLLKTQLAGVTALRDVTLNHLETHRRLLNPVLFARAHHVVSENERTRKAAFALEQQDMRALGQLMQESHISLRDDYEVSCPELNAMVDVASTVRGNYGTRMMGGGFGGSTISLVEHDKVDNFVKEMKDGYLRQTGVTCECYVCSPVTGADEEATG
jgi:galactokinase